MSNSNWAVPMKCAGVFLLGVLTMGSAQAGEARINAGWAFGHSTISDSANNELSFDSSVLGLGGVYFLGEPGVFLGASLVQGKVRNVEFNGQDAGFGSLDLKGRALTIGYRTGTKGEAQFLLSVSALQSDVEGESSNATGLSIGVEKDYGTSRWSLGGSYNDGDGTQSTGLDIKGVFFVGADVGFFIAGGFSTGQVDLGSETGDSTDLRFASGIELRFFPK